MILREAKPSLYELIEAIAKSPRPVLVHKLVLWNGFDFGHQMVVQSLTSDYNMYESIRLLYMCLEGSNMQDSITLHLI